YSTFLTELRPIVALFLRFEGIDYEQDPDARQKLNAYITACQHIVQQYQGNIIQLTVGDKGSYAYAVFGAPQAHEDDVARALSTALEIQALDEAHHVQTQIGVSRGTARSGAYGSHKRKTYGVISDDVNLAARLMAKAQPGTILVNDNLLDKAKMFTFQQLPPVQLKGKSLPVAISQLIGRKARQETLFQDAFIGREIELNTLLDWVLNVQRSEAYTIYGEAGIGKTRLANELMRQLRDYPIRQVTIIADGLLQQTLKPFISWLEDYFGLANHETTEAKLRAFDLVMDELIAESQSDSDLHRELTSTRPFLASILNLPTDTQLVESAGGKLRYDNVVIGIRALFKIFIRNQSVFLYVEDAHWLDRLSLELLHTIMQDNPDEKLTLLLTSRPQRDDEALNWGFDAAIPQQQMELAFLSRSGVKQLAENHLLGDVSDSFVEVLFEKSKGNPFFVEQILLSLQERHALIQVEQVWMMSSDAIMVPDDLHTLLVSRIDGLVPEAKVTVKAASIFGQRFETTLVERMLPTLEAHKYVQLAEQRSIWHAEQVPTYVFHHALLRDVAYEMQPEAQRRELHHQAAEIIEVVYPNDDNQLEALLFHWGRALNQAKYIRYARDFVVKQADITNYQEVIALCDECLALDLSAEDRVHFQLYKAQSVSNLGNMSQAVEMLRHALTYLQEDGAVAEEHKIKFYLGMYVFQLGQRQEGQALVEQALTKARLLNDTKTVANSLRILGMFKGTAADARELLEDSLRIMPDLRFQSITLINLGWFASNAEKDFKEAIRCYKEALQLATQINFRQVMSWALNNLAGAYANLGDLDESRIYSDQGIKLARTTQDKLALALALDMRGQLEVSEHQYFQAVAYFEQAAPMLRAMQNVIPLARCLEMYSLAHIYGKDMQAARELMREVALLAQTYEHELVQFHTLCLYAIYLTHNEEPIKSAMLAAMLQKVPQNMMQFTAWIERTQALLQETLSEAEYQAAVEQGAGLDYESEWEAFLALMNL
ncbi:MAG: AAA family ATPase, partial [Anaerolineae bacterium]|nr:AAA family ATPase [Anaerolineae bacterium]